MLFLVYRVYNNSERKPPGEKHEVERDLFGRNRPAVVGAGPRSTAAAATARLLFSVQRVFNNSEPKPLDEKQEGPRDCLWRNCRKCRRRGR